MRDSISLASKVFFGWFLSIIVFVAYQMLLIGSTSGTGSWDGMTIFYGSIFIVPGLFVANCWVLPLQWPHRSSIFLASLSLPAVIGLVEYAFLYGGPNIRRMIHAAFVAAFIWVWVCIILLFMPLLASVAYAVSLGRKNG
jgi:hypothetical protein